MELWSLVVDCQGDLIYAVCMTTTNYLTEADRDAVSTFLRERGYLTLEFWALDGDYYFDDDDFVWRSTEDDRVVDLEPECFRHIEQQGELQDEQRYG